MKKLFTLFTALLVVCAANAETISITPTSPETSDNLRKALNKAQNGDEIVMAAGTYVESNGNYIAFTGKHVTVKAADGAEVLIQPQVPITISEGGCAHFVGVKFDVSRLTELASWYEHLMYPSDANASNSIILNGCELYNFNMNKSLLYCATSNTLASISINNCYFHNIVKSCLFIENTGAINISITNSTFANITTDAGSYSAGVIDSRATEGSFLVDHCTFYDVQVMNTDYAAIGKVKLPSGAVVSNCIFAFSESASSNYRAIRDAVTANNCLVYNYTADSGYGMQGDVTKNNCFIADPLFTDAANGDFSYAGNWTTGEVSPARGAGTDGSDLGDPRWYTDEEIPSTDFSYTLSNTTPQLKGNVNYDSENKEIVYLNKSEQGTATWKLHANRACYVTASFHSGNGSGHQLRIEILDSEKNSVGSIQEASAQYSGDMNIPGMILIPSVGDYTIILSNLTTWSSSQISALSLNYYPVSVVGTSALTGVDWDPSDETNDMSYDAESGNFVWTKEKFFHDGSSTYSFKIAKNRAYAFPSENWTITEGFFENGAGYYNLKIEYTPSPEAANVTATHLYPKVEIKGGFNSWTLVELENNSEGVLSTTIHITPNDYTGGNGFKVRYNGDDGNQWGNLGNMVRTNCSNWSFDNRDNNCGIIADVEGDYVFSFTIEGGKWSVTYPMTFTRGVTNTNYGTICLPCAAVLTGATAYSVDPAHVAEGYVTLTEVGTELTAGVPYIIKPEAVGTISAVMSGDAVASPVNNNLYGVWGATQTFGAGEGVYALHDNKLTLVSGSAQVNVPSTKAYFKVAAASAPVLRILEGEEIVTNISDVKDEEQTIKFIENGQLFIRKNGIVYDALGRAVR